MNQTWLQFNYDAKINQLEKIKERAIRNGYLVGPRKILSGTSSSEWYDTWIYLLLRAIESSETIGSRINPETSMIIIPVRLLCCICMSKYFKYNKDNEQIIGPYLAGTLASSFSVVACPNVADNKVYVYDVLSGNVVSFDVEDEN